MFAEISSAPFLNGNFRGKTIWTAVLHDPENFKLHFKLYTENSLSLYKIELEDDGKSGTVGTLDLTYTSTSKKGNKLVVKNVGEKIHVMLTIIIAMLKHYCETGSMITLPSLQKVILSDQRLTLKDKFIMGLNRRAFSRMKDRNRGRFMRKFHRA